MMKESKDFQPPLTLLDSVEYTKSLKDPRYIKTHLPWTLLPTQIQNNKKQPKVIKLFAVFKAMPDNYKIFVKDHLRCKKSKRYLCVVLLSLSFN